MSVLILALIGWITFGAVAVAIMHRRGHDTFSWAVLFLFLGPIALPVAISSERNHPVEPSRPLPPGELDLRVWHDGTADAQAALDSALHWFGPRLTSVTVATVVDFEASSTVRGQETQHVAQEQRDAIAGDVATKTKAPVATVVLYGEPASAIQHFAAENGFELIVAGHGSSRRSLVGHARQRAASRSVPVLIGPASA